MVQIYFCMKAHNMLFSIDVAHMIPVTFCFNGNAAALSPFLLNPLFYLSTFDKARQCLDFSRKNKYI